MAKKSDNNKRQRVLKININKSNKYFKIFDECCYKSKNLYNVGMYYIRNHYIATKKINDNMEITEQAQEIINENREWVNNYNKEIGIKNKNTIISNNILEVENVDIPMDGYNKTVKAYNEIVGLKNDEIAEVNSSIKAKNKEIMLKNKEITILNNQIKKENLKNKKLLNGVIADLTPKIEKIKTIDKFKRINNKLTIMNKWYGELLDDSILDKMLKQHESYKELNGDDSTALIKSLNSVWTGYFESISDYHKNKSKYTGEPKIPKYIKGKEDGRYVFATRRSTTLKDEILHIDKGMLKEYGIKFKVPLDDNCKINQIRLVPRDTYIAFEIVYEIEVPNIELNDRRASIDIGVNRLATVCNNIGMKPIAINGLPLKSANNYWNKQMAEIKSTLMKTNGLYTSKKLKKITEKRNNYVNTYIHKASTHIVRHLQENDIKTVIIGKNKGWKFKADLGRYTQNFVQIPMARFINMIEYKCETAGIKVILNEESYTSGTSFIDNEIPNIKDYNKDRRKYRGLFISNKGLKIHSDVNGAYQIMKKVDKDYTYNGQYLHPTIINIA